MSRRLSWGVAVGATLLITLTGCTMQPGAMGSAPTGGSQQAQSTGGDACGSEPGFCISVAITGATTVQGSAHTIKLSSCADYVKGTTDKEIKLPGLLGEKIGDHEITSVNQIRAYSGPGQYGEDAMSSVAGVLDIDVDTTPYQLTDDTTASAEINPDGSGSFTFTDFKEGEQGNPTKAKGTISGKITWTCTD
jgi:hypothetical protein